LVMQFLVNGQVNGRVWNQIQCVAQPQSNRVVNPHIAGVIALTPQTCDPTPGATTNSCAALVTQCTAISGCTASTTQSSATQGTVTCNCPNTSTASGACDQSQMTTINFLTGSVTVHKSMVSKLQAIDARWRSLGGNSYYPVTSIGSYNCRAVTGGSGYSMHAYGYAIDINPGPNRYVKPKPAGGCPTNMTSQNPPFYTLFTSQGFGWGGNWSSLCDAMHFSAAAREGGWIP
ncbi:M15 family metallopeptidase, partial [Candidatus Kaiserbacteria bacterium]|nr:M15 family metallopeptidase [Candidatus Kaiserbacteria bacterium]